MPELRYIAGLNVEQRKRLTIGVELAAKPELLLFLDEPTSGLDSQTSWAICDLMEKLTRAGQAILCTIHQPSAMLFQRFDRLLFLQSGGRTVYFGEVGENSAILIDYFERNGGPRCPEAANPAEWMLEVIGAAPGTSTTIDWHATWRASPEYVEVQRHLAELKEERPKITRVATTSTNKAAYRAFAQPFLVQLREVQWRVFAQFWRTPSCASLRSRLSVSRRQSFADIYSKLILCAGCGLFIDASQPAPFVRLGLTCPARFTFFRADRTQSGVQAQLYSIFVRRAR
jgi:energy-coupling factor transporter ATP-binding protein EcfA2